MLKEFKKLFTGQKKLEKADRNAFIVMLIGGVIALAAAFILTVEKIHLLETPDAVLSCSINIVLNCSTVMNTWQSELFGFPNMLIGMMAYPVVITVAIIGLAAVRLPRWFLLAANAGFGLGLIFSYWLFFSSVYAIEVLCPWCLLVTFATTLIFSSMLHYNLRHNIFEFKKKTNAKIQKFLEGGYHQMIVISWFVIMIALVLLKFGDGLFA